MGQDLNLTQKMKFHEIFEWSFKLYKNNFWFFIKTVSYFLVPAIIIFLTFGYIVYQKTLLGIWPEFSTLINSNNPELLFEDTTFLMKFVSSMGQITGNIFLIITIYSILNIYIRAASVKAISVKLNGTPESVKDIVKETLKKSFYLIMTSFLVTLLYGLALLFSALLLFIPALILIVYFTFIPQAIMVENKYFGNAISRSFSITKKNFWSIVLISIVFGFFYYIISGIINSPANITYYVKVIQGALKNSGMTDPEGMFSFYKNFSLLYILQMALGLMLYFLFYSPILNIALTLKFYNIRNLREGTQILENIDAVTQDAKDTNFSENSES